MIRLPTYLFFFIVGCLCFVYTGNSATNGDQAFPETKEELSDSLPLVAALANDSLLLPSFLPDTVWVSSHLPDIDFILAEDTLRMMALDVVRPVEDSLRLAKNELFMSHLMEVVAKEGGMQYPFDSLSTVSFLTPPDSSFRIITWYVPLSGQQFRYFGLVQVIADLVSGSSDEPGGKSRVAVSGMDDQSGRDPSHEDKKIFKLKEVTDFRGDADTVVFAHDAWYGTWYYDLVSKQHDNEVSYTLLGWRADQPNTRKRIIEPLSFRNGEPLFGAQVFELPAEQHAPAGQTAPGAPGAAPRRADPRRRIVQPEPLSRAEQPARIVFEYSVRVTMGLLFDNQSPRPGTPAEPMIVFDRLEPLDEEHRGDRAFYVPEGNIFDAFLFREGRWLLVRDVDARGRE